MRFISWNIDSINAALTGESERSELTRDVLKKIGSMDAEFIAIQETKLPVKGLNKKQEEALKEFFPDYNYAYVSSREPARKGYAGVMLLYKDKDLTVEFPEIGAPKPMDLEGRIISCETPEFHFVGVYTPNAGDGLKRLSERQEWDVCFRDYLKKLDESKPVIACGDFNVAHEEIDLKNPATNHMSPGFTDEEREGFSNLLAAGFTDTFRALHPGQEGAYSWWSQRIRSAKANNAGWRIDYFLVSSRIFDRVKDSTMIDSGARADHTPIMLDIE